MAETQLPEIKYSQYARRSLFSNRVAMQRRNEDRIVSGAIRRIKEHLHFKGRDDWIQLDFDEAGTLRLEGVLPTFYLKQLAQEAVRAIEGVLRVQNDIVVSSSTDVEGCGDGGDNANRPTRETSCKPK